MRISRRHARVGAPDSQRATAFRPQLTDRCGKSGKRMQLLSHLVGAERQKMYLDVRRRQPRIGLEERARRAGGNRQRAGSKRGIAQAMIAVRAGLLTISLSVIACAHRITMRTCMWSCRSRPTRVNPAPHRYHAAAADPPVRCQKAAEVAASYRRHLKPAPPCAHVPTEQCRAAERLRPWRGVLRT